MKKSSRTIGVFQLQADAVLNQVNPGDGTQYEILPTTLNCRIISVAIRCTWTVQPTPLELHGVIDGQTILAAVVNPVSNTWYFPLSDAENAANALVLGPVSGNQDQYREYWLEGRSIRLLGEISGGTVSNLSARVKYQRM